MNIFTNKECGKPPLDKKEILELVVVNGAEGVGRSKTTLENLLTPMKDLVALYQFLDNVDAAAGRYADLLQEQEALTSEVASVKANLVSAKGEFDSATKIQGAALAKVTSDTSTQIASLAAQVADLEKIKADLSKQIKDKQVEKLRLNAEVSAEYKRLRVEMLAKCADEEKAVRRKNLEALEAKVKAAQAELDSLVEKKRQFLASLGG